MPKDFSVSNDYHIRSRTLSFRKEIALDAQILKVKHLQKCFGKAEVLHDLNFTVSAGEVYGLIGHNGAVKTTLLRLIAGLMEPTKGSIDCSTEKSYIGYMPQSCRFDGRDTVFSTVSFFASLRKADVNESITLCKRLKLDTTKKAKFLSPGQQKKLQMVIAMAGDPDFYVLDEPTAGLDPSATYEMAKIIQELHQRGKSILISSHILQDMDDLCTKVAIIENGCLIYNRELENIYTVKTGAFTAETFALLKQKYPVNSNPQHTTLRVQTDKQGVATIIKILTSQSVDIYEVVRSNVKDVVQEQLHMGDKGVQA